MISNLVGLLGIMVLSVLSMVLGCKFGFELVWSL